MAKGIALITGASGGIGLEFAKIFAREGYDLVLVARSEAKLNEIAADVKAKYGVNSTVLARDLGQPSAPDEIFATLTERGIQVDALVNNAGFATYGEFNEIELQTELQMMQLNMVTLTHLTKLFLTGMKARKRGYILNVGSTAAFLPGPLMAVYYATKSYVLSFSVAIARELKGTGVQVSALCPGPTQSGFQERAAMQDSKLVQNDLMTATEVAEQGYQGLIKGQTVVVPGFANQVITFLPRLLPRDVAADMAMNAQQRVGH